MTMDYGLTPAEQAAQRATQRADDTRRRRAAEDRPSLESMPTSVPIRFARNFANFGDPPKYTKPQIARSPITPSVRTAPMTGPASRDWQTGMSGLPAFEPKVPLDLSRAGQKQTLGRSPVPPMQQEINPLQLPAAVGTMRPPIYDAPMPMPMPTLPSRIGPMTGPAIRRGTDIGVDTSPWYSGGAFEPNSTGRIWDRTQPYPTPSRIGPAVVPPRGFTGQIERGNGLYPQMQQEINPLQVPPVLGNALQSMRQWRNRYINPIESPMRQVVEGF